MPNLASHRLYAIGFTRTACVFLVIYQVNKLCLQAWQGGGKLLTIWAPRRLGLLYTVCWMSNDVFNIFTVINHTRAFHFCLTRVSSCSILIKSFTHTHRAQNAHVAISSLTSTVDRLDHQQVDLMQVIYPHRLRQLVLDKSVSSCRTDLLQVNGQNLPSTILLQVVTTSCNKRPSDDSLQQAWF